MDSPRPDGSLAHSALPAVEHDDESAHDSELPLPRARSASSMSNNSGGGALRRERTRSGGDTDAAREARLLSQLLVFFSIARHVDAPASTSSASSMQHAMGRVGPSVAMATPHLGDGSDRHGHVHARDAELRSASFARHVREMNVMGVDLPVAVAARMDAAANGALLSSRPSERELVQHFLLLPPPSQTKVAQSMFVIPPSLINDFTDVLQFFMRVIMEAHSDSAVPHLQQRARRRRRHRRQQQGGVAEGTHTSGGGSHAWMRGQQDDSDASSETHSGIGSDSEHEDSDGGDLMGVAMHKMCSWARNGDIACATIQHDDAYDSPASGSTGNSATARGSTMAAFSFPPGFQACLMATYGSVKRNKCEEVWHGDHMAYRCRTCGLSDSSCMCLACFDPADHEGHDYRVYRCASGGCCDCGDPLAWKASGFCKHHRSDSTTGNERKKIAMGDVERAIVYSLVRRVVAFCINVLREVYLFCLRPGFHSPVHGHDSDLTRNSDDGNDGTRYPMRRYPKAGRRRQLFPGIIQVHLDRLQQSLAWLQMFAMSCVEYRDILTNVLFEELPADFHLDPPARKRRKNTTTKCSDGQREFEGDEFEFEPSENRGNCGDGISGVIDMDQPQHLPCDEESASPPLLILDVFLKAGVLLPMDICDSLGVLYLKLLFDHDFKQRYTCHFVDWYPYFIELYIIASEENNDDGMRNLSRFIDRLFCQLFHSVAQLEELEKGFKARQQYRTANSESKDDCVQVDDSRHGELNDCDDDDNVSSSSSSLSCVEFLLIFLLDKLNDLFKSTLRVETIEWFQSTDHGNIQTNPDTDSRQQNLHSTEAPGNVPPLTTRSIHVVDCGRSIFKKRVYARLCSDIRTLLVDPSVASKVLLGSFRVEEVIGEKPVGEGDVLEMKSGSDLSSVSVEVPEGDQIRHRHHHRIVFERQSVYGLLIQAFQSLQQMDLQQRHVHQHIEFESQNWTFAFVVDYEMNLLLSTFVSGIPYCFSDDPKATLMHMRCDREVINNGFLTIDAMSTARALLAPLQESVLQWANNHAGGRDDFGCSSEEMHQASFGTASDTLSRVFEERATEQLKSNGIMKRSFHLPLHHMYAMFLQGVSAIVRPYTPDDWQRLIFGDGIIMASAEFADDAEPRPNNISSTPTTAATSTIAVTSQDWSYPSRINFLYQMVEHPLRVCIFSREIKAGIWVRNGNAMWQQLVHYYAKHWRYSGLHSDLFFNQFVGLLLPKGQYTRIFFRHFAFRREESRVLVCHSASGPAVGEGPHSHGTEGRADSLPATTAREMENEIELLEELNRLLLQIVLSPFRLIACRDPVNAVTWLLEREVMHWLSLGPCTRSEVLAHLDMKLVDQARQKAEHPWYLLEEEEIVSNVLELVGEYNDPQVVGNVRSGMAGGGSVAGGVTTTSQNGNVLGFGMKMSGTWKLKADRWQEVSPLFECFSPSESQLCEQNVRKHVDPKGEGCYMQPVPHSTQDAEVSRSLAEAILDTPSLLAMAFIVLKNYLTEATIATKMKSVPRSESVVSEDIRTSESLLVSVLNCLFVTVKLIDADAGECDSHSESGTESLMSQSQPDTSLVDFVIVEEAYASHKADSFFSKLCIEHTQQSMSLLSLLKATSSVPQLSTDALSLCRTITQLAEKKSPKCHDYLACQRKEDNSADPVLVDRTGSFTSDHQEQKKEMMRQRQQAIMAKMRKQQLHFLSSQSLDSEGDSESKARSTTRESIEQDKNNFRRSDDVEDSDIDDENDEDDEEEEDEWGFPTGHLDIELYLGHLSSAIALSCERERQERRRKLRRKTRPRDTRAPISESSTASSSWIGSADRNIGDEDGVDDVNSATRHSEYEIGNTDDIDDPNDELPECGLCRLQCDPDEIQSPFGTVGMILPTLIPSKVGLTSSQTALPTLSSISVSTTLMSTATGKVPSNAVLGDTMVWSCGHHVHHACIKSYLVSLWKQRSARGQRLNNGDDRLLSERAMEFLCPICRRLANSIVPNVRAVVSSHPRHQREPAASARLRDGGVDSGSGSQSEEHGRVFLRWLENHVQIDNSDKDTWLLVARFSSPETRISITDSESPSLYRQSARAHIDKFSWDIKLHGMRASMQIPIFLGGGVDTNENMVNDEIHIITDRWGQQIPQWRILLRSLESQVDVVQFETVALGVSTGGLDKNRVESLRSLLELAISSVVIAQTSKADDYGLDALQDTMKVINDVLFGRRVLFADKDDFEDVDQMEEDNAAVEISSPDTDMEKGAPSFAGFDAPLLSHPRLFSLFCTRLLWVQATATSAATCGGIEVDAVPSNQDFSSAEELGYDYASDETVVADTYFMARVVVTAQILQALCSLAVTDDINVDTSTTDEHRLHLPSSPPRTNRRLQHVGDFRNVESLSDAMEWAVQLVTRARLLPPGKMNSSAPTAVERCDRETIENYIIRQCLPLLRRIMLLMEVSFPRIVLSTSVQDRGNAANGEPCAVCDELFAVVVVPTHSDDATNSPVLYQHVHGSDDEITNTDRVEFQNLLRRLHLPPLRLFFRRHVFSSTQRELCQLWAAQLESQAAVLRGRSRGECDRLLIPRTPSLWSSATRTASSQLSNRLIMELPRVYMELFVKYNERPLGVCTRCQQLPQHPAICLLCGEVCCCFSTCCESTRGRIGECTEHAQSCGLGTGAFLLLRACTVILFLGNERRCVWGSLYVDKNGEEDPYLRRGRTLFLATNRLAALEALLITHSYTQNTAILANTSRRDGRRY